MDKVTNITNPDIIHDSITRFRSFNRCGLVIKTTIHVPARITLLRVVLIKVFKEPSLLFVT
jgi:hypothetical protein